MDQQVWDRFAARMRELKHLSSMGSLLGWDEQTMMPPKAAPGRAAVTGTLAALEHERLSSAEYADLIAALEDQELDREHRVTVELARRERDQAVKMPARLVRELAETASLAQSAWVKARSADDYSIFQPLLDKTFRLKAEQAEALGYEKEPYDAHLDLFERGATAELLKPMFDSVAAGLGPLLEAIKNSETPIGDLPDGPYDTKVVLDYCKDLLQRAGYDMESGRLDLSAHPFSTGIGPHDNRITTRIMPDDPQEAILATLHEMGHAQYEAGLRDDWRESTLGVAASLGIHESQSRLWENHVGRSLPFWEGEFAQAQRVLHPWSGETAESVFRAINKVEPSLIRVKADEITYPLHIAVRFELELAICRGELSTNDLPAAWDDAYERHLGIRPPSNKDGVLQDVHWSFGALGYFPTYLIGSVYAAALFEAATRALGGPEVVESQLRVGEFSSLLIWLRRHVHEVGSSRLPAEIVADATGAAAGGIDTEPYLSYMRSKYSALYELPAGVDGRRLGDPSMPPHVVPPAPNVGQHGDVGGN
ncbi:MAG: carboxypeptidase M32 [Actinomycetota bacterium]